MELATRRNTDQARLPRIAITMPNWVGDACMATPTLTALRASYPDCHIVGIMTPVVAELLNATDKNNDWFSDVILFSKRRKKRKANTQANLPVSRLGLIGALRRRKIDIHLLLTNSWWSAAVAHWGKSRSVVGYRRDLRSYYLTEGLPVPKQGRKFKPISAVDYYLAVGEWIGCDAKSKRMSLPLTVEDQQNADGLWEYVGFDPLRPTIVINSNAAKDSSRVWPEQHVTELAGRLASEDYQVLLHCGPGESDSANAIARKVNHPLVASMGVMQDLPFGLSRGVLAKASVVVSTDSGARHMAVALGKPVVTLFGSTSSAWTETYNVPEVKLSEPVDCAPCYRRVCPLGHHNCMHKLSVTRVFEAVRKQLSRGPGKTGELDAATGSQIAYSVAV